MTEMLLAIKEGRAQLRKRVQLVRQNSTRCRRQFSRRRKNIALLVASTLTRFWLLVITAVTFELVQVAGSSSCSVCCKTKPVEGAGQRRFNWLRSKLNPSFFIEGVPATS